MHKRKTIITSDLHENSSISHVFFYFENEKNAKSQEFWTDGYSSFFITMSARFFLFKHKRIVLFFFENKIKSVKFIVVFEPFNYDIFFSEESDKDLQCLWWKYFQQILEWYTYVPIKKAPQVTQIHLNRSETILFGCVTNFKGFCALSQNESWIEIWNFSFFILNYG